LRGTPCNLVGRPLPKYLTPGPSDACGRNPAAQPFRSRPPRHHFQKHRNGKGELASAGLPPPRLATLPPTLPPSFELAGPILAISFDRTALNMCWADRGAAAACKGSSWRGAVNPETGSGIMFGEAGSRRACLCPEPKVKPRGGGSGIFPTGPGETSFFRVRGHQCGTRGAHNSAPGDADARRMAVPMR
jgi:hypothetical protein